MTIHLYAHRYESGDLVGLGLMSEVYRGRDLRMGRDVAIKVLRADLARDPLAHSRFRREAQNAASLNHPSIVAVYDTGEAQGEAGIVPYIVMEYVDGQTLRDLVAGEGALPIRTALEIAAEICAALDFSHRHGIVHRDVNPSNIMVSSAGAAKVMDFGVARAVKNGQALTTATTIIGTAQYLSPEQARGETGDARSDIYSAGCVLYEMLCGAAPFTGASPIAVASQHIRVAARPPSESRPGLPRDIDALVLKSLSKNPQNRYQTADEMRKDVARAMSGRAVLATPVMSSDERQEFLRATPVRIEPVPAAAGRAGSGRAALGWAGSGRAGSGRAGSGRAGSALGSAGSGRAASGTAAAGSPRARESVLAQPSRPDSGSAPAGFVGSGAAPRATGSNAAALSTGPGAAARAAGSASGSDASPAPGSGAGGAGGAPALHGPPLLAPVLTLPPPGNDDARDPAEIARTRRRWTLIGIAGVCLSVVVALTLTVLVITRPLPPAAVAVPDLTGMTMAEAAAALQEKHLTLGTVTQVDVPDTQPGTIVNQRPSFRTQVDQDTPVNVEVDQ